MLELATQLKGAREKAGYSQNDLALILNVTRQAISKWETGKTYPDIDNLVFLSDFYQLTLDELVKESFKRNK